MSDQIVRFGPFTFDHRRKLLLRKGAPVAIGHRGLVLLDTLLAAEGRVVSKSELMDAAWQSATVEESNLSVQIAALRKCLGKSQSGEEWISTVQRVGYQFVQPGETRDDGNSRAVPKQSKPEVLSDKPSIAVLPFVNLSGDPGQEYFADGVVEEIIMALSRMRWLFVIARNSSFTYKGRAVDVKHVGRDLGVRYVLEGSVRQSGRRLRIAAQLIDASTGVHLWADRFDGEVDDVFDLQDQVTARVVGAIAPKLEEAEIARMTSKATESLDAYDQFLRGMMGIHKWSRQGNDEALSHFYQAIEIDPNYAAAYGMAARAYIQRISGGWVEDRVREVAETERLAYKAADLGRDDAVALSTAGFALSDVAHLIEEGDALIDRALGLNPNLAWAWLYSCWTKCSLGLPELALERIAQAQRLSPNDPQTFSFCAARAMAQLCLERYTEAYESAVAAIRQRPEFMLYNCIAAVSAVMIGRSDDARKIGARMLTANPTLRLSTIRNLMPFRRPEDTARWVKGLTEAGVPE